MLGTIATKAGVADIAARYLGAAEAVRQDIDTPLGRPEQTAHDWVTAELTKELGPDTLWDYFAAGGAMSIDEAIDMARSVRPDGPPVATSSS